MTNQSGPFGRLRAGTIVAILFLLPLTAADTAVADGCSNGTAISCMSVASGPPPQGTWCPEKSALFLYNGSHKHCIKTTSQMQRMHSANGGWEDWGPPKTIYLKPATRAFLSCSKQHPWIYKWAITGAEFGCP